jgi:hypothetical protein
VRTAGQRDAAPGTGSGVTQKLPGDMDAFFALIQALV